ncbi:LSM domain protein [Spironucleus salmonicida]|nr:LSM domain protein [Spironucleus salmonicida]|eukprot:EST44807.1 LSM domain protein [Spironucleus salmonicida]
MDLLLPAAFLQAQLGQPVTVELKSGQVLTGQLEAADAYYNLRLSGASLGAEPMGHVTVRCNNVLTVAK